MVDLSLLSDDELDQLESGGASSLSDDALDRIQGVTEQKSGLQRASEFLGSNMEIPGAIAGGITGATYGSAFGPIGIAVGGVVGGAFGSFGGSLASDRYNEEALNFEGALDEATTSVMFDVATLGAGKLLRPIAKTIGLNTSDLLMNFAGRGKADPVLEITKLPKNIASGSEESLALTQQLLEQGGGSLSAVQTGQASFLRATAEEIGEVGLLSGTTALKRISQNNEVLGREVQRLVDGIDPSLAREVSDVGEEVYGIVKAGQKAAEELYDTGLTSIKSELGSERVGVMALKSMTKKFERQFTSKLLGNTLSASSKNLVKDLESGLFNIQSAKVADLIDLDKEISKRINEALPGSATASPQAYRELSEFRTQFRNTLESVLQVQAPKQGAAYKALKNSYGVSTNSILPELNRNVVSAASKGNFDVLGKLLITGQNTSKVQTFMRSIDASYADIAKANKALGASGKELIVPPISTAKRAKALVRQSYIKENFKKGLGNEVDFKSLRSLAQTLSNPSSQKRLTAIMGEDLGGFKRLVNAIQDSSTPGKRGLFNLAIRSQEINAGAKIAQAGGSIGLGAAGAMGTMTAGLPLAAGILIIPSVLAKIATNPRAVNRLIALNSQVAKNPNMTPEFLVSNIGKVLEELSDEDRGDLSADLGISLQ
jgi:hypothetical protein